MSTLAALGGDLERRKQVRMRLRSDLDIAPQKYEGKTYHVVKDPVSLRYYRFSEQEHFILQLMDGDHTLEEAQKEFEKRFRPDRLTLEDLERFAQQLITVGLVINESPQAGKLLYEKRSKRKRNEWLGTLTNILYIKIPIFDPDKLLNAMLPWTRWIFTTWFFVLSILLMLSAVFLVLSHFGTFQEKLPNYQEFFSFKTAIYLWITLGIVKVIHEFGHGLSCKAFGGEVHEMGALFLCLSPCLYCNVSDSWTLPSKWKRMIISFAGIYVELVIAAISTFIWWNSPTHPFVNNLSLSLMIVCSVSTVVFNANPLMRFDGYYILADWMEIPNMRDRANRYLKNLVMEHCLGMEVYPEPYMATTRQILFVTYAVGSYIYRWVVTFSILWFLSRFLGPKLVAVSYMLTFAALASMVGWPLFRMLQGIYKRGRLPDMKPRRVAVCAAVIAVALVLFFVVPLPWTSRVRQVGLVQVEPTSEEKVWVVTPGILDVLHVWDGKPVVKGEILAEFRSLELEGELELARSQLNVAEVEEKAQATLLTAARDDQDRIKIRQDMNAASGEVIKYRAQVRSLEERRTHLKLRAPRNGIVMSPPKKEEVNRLWEKAPDVPFCGIGDPAYLRVVVPVSPSDYNIIKEDMANSPSKDLPVTIRIQGRGAATWSGKITDLPQSEARDVPIQLTTRGGGPLAIKPGTSDKSFIPQSQQYLVPVEIIDEDQAICPGSMAQVKIHCHGRTGAWWLWHTVSSTFNLPLM